MSLPIGGSIGLFLPICGGEKLVFLVARFGQNCNSAAFFLTSNQEKGNPANPQQFPPFGPGWKGFGGEMMLFCRNFARFSPLKGKMLHPCRN
ncbi:hypothetical protein M5W83_22295 [Paenibacillus thiaminolyticus]|uniref:Uncharacterized protein n=1 Tax=Paenibacillus thiaminolyticus TaxID=49283 RepID=A0AAP9J2D6_PANTH|nr:hypothetical protein [Paenibacillus thiaminolyticus]MCY9537414.1 hypothetical protein [Paenibacillus thiaminolyticus]MCY9602006.1 hypothetical protein [Paenibacillus thiaminolyticus]MCY9609889.1 hypothetical protein [Paenibacillus thiaminolyticus]MCY9613833.1 hypothetical protein [Paenibacillus thiaminolyticus]MCY9620735.1 hypothetical protein [Paenibacillus thiaminolyticus]